MSVYLDREQRWSDRHPMCDCPRSPTFPWYIQVLENCFGGKIAHPSALTSEEIKLFVAHLKGERHAKDNQLGR